MNGLGETIFKQGIKEGLEQGREKGREEGIKALILDYLEEGMARERVLLKLQKRFNLNEEREGVFGAVYLKQALSC